MEIDTATSVIGSTLATYLIASPLYLTWLVGIVLALRARHQRPTVARLALIGLLLLFGLSLLSTLLSMWVPVWIFERYDSMAPLAAYNIGFGLFSSLLSVVAWAFILAALFGRQSEE
jgi:uncharacterized membrane protein